MTQYNINATKEYDKFVIEKKNRNIKLTKKEAKDLRKSMKESGWLTAYPMMVRSNGDGKLHVVDGQHRYTIARELRIPVKYVIDNTDIDVAMVNQAQSTWKLRDYLDRWKKEGIEDYYEVDKFKSLYPEIPLGFCVGLLSGTYSYSNVISNFKSGRFKVRSKHLAYKIGNIYEEIVSLNSNAKSTNFLKALYSCFFVDDFDPKKFLDSCKKRPHLIQSYSKIKDFREMIEEIYNYSRKTARIPLAFLAEEAMAERSAAKK